MSENRIDPVRGCPMKLSAALTSQEFLRDRAATVGRMQAAGGVVEVKFPLVGRVWMTTTQELASRVLKDGKLFTVRKDDGDVAGMRWWMPRILRVLTSTMASADDKDHARLRGIVDEAFRRRAVLEMEPRIRAIADELAADMFAQGSPADLVTRYAQQLPLLVICELLGLPPADQPKFTAWADRVTGISSPLGLLRALPALSALKRYLEKQLDRVGKVGGEGLIAELVRTEKEGARLSRDEIVATVFLLLFAGHETTKHLISGAVFELAKNPALRDWLAQDWSRADLAVEEFLRFVSPVQVSQLRFVRRDVDLGGVQLKRGDKIMTMLVAANLDAAANASPDTLDLARKPNHHIAFGTGVHFCLGYQLARLEAKCALEALYKRWPKLELAVEPGEIRWRRHPSFRAIISLPVRRGAE